MSVYINMYAIMILVHAWFEISIKLSIKSTNKNNYINNIYYYY